MLSPHYDIARSFKVDAQSVLILYTMQLYLSNISTNCCGIRYSAKINMLYCCQPNGCTLILLEPLRNDVSVNVHAYGSCLPKVSSKIRITCQFAHSLHSSKPLHFFQRFDHIRHVIAQILAAIQFFYALPIAGWAWLIRQYRRTK